MIAVSARCPFMNFLDNQGQHWHIGIVLGQINFLVNVLFHYVEEGAPSLEKKALLASDATVLVAPSICALGVHHGYFHVSPLIVTSSSIRSVRPFIVWPCDASAFSIYPMFLSMSSITLMIQLKGKTARWNNASKKTVNTTYLNFTFIVSCDDGHPQAECDHELESSPYHQ
jgi:hypothetical protein